MFCNKIYYYRKKSFINVIKPTIYYHWAVSKMNVNVVRQCCRLLFVLSKNDRFCRKRHSSNVVKSQIEDIQIPNVSIHEFIFENFNKWPLKVAIECGITGKKYTYEEIRVKSISLSYSLSKKLGFSKGDVVAIILPNLPEYPICILGALRAGLVVTTLNPSYTTEEIEKQLSHVKVKAIIALTSLVETIRTSQLQIPIIGIRKKATDLLPDSVLCFTELTETCVFNDGNCNPIDGNDIALMPSTGGTTGIPKLVELTHRNIVSNILQMCHPRFNFRRSTTDNHQDISLAVLPFFHIYGIVAIILTSMFSMSKILSLPQFQPEGYGKILTEHKPHILYVVPHMINILSSSLHVRKEAFESVRTLFTAAAPLGPSDAERFSHKVVKPIDIIQAYGLTETSPCVTMLHPEIKMSGSVGEVLPNTSIKIVELDGSSKTALGPNIPGEILVKGPQVMKGYYKQPEETRNVFINEWFKTGDIGFFDSNNILYITDRLKDIIKVKGFQVAPAELEAIIRDHPSVLEAAVIGIPDRHYGEIPKAYVVLKKNTNGDVNEIYQYVAQRTIDYKKIRGGIVAIGEIPKSPAGKILRKTLKLMHNEYRNID